MRCVIAARASRDAAISAATISPSAAADASLAVTSRRRARVPSVIAPTARDALASLCACSAIASRSSTAARRRSSSSMASAATR